MTIPSPIPPGQPRPSAEPLDQFAPAPWREPGDTPGDSASHPLQQVAAALRGLKFGQITLTIQDGVIVMIERTEKRRLV